MDQPLNIPAVLVVDDDDIVLSTVSRALENTGYRVLTASSAKEALAIAQAGGAHVSVAILDYGMLDMSGTELGAELTRTSPEMRILISSGMPAGSIELLPGQRFLDKPFNARTLLRAVLGEVLDASAASLGSSD